MATQATTLTVLHEGARRVIPPSMAVASLRVYIREKKGAAVFNQKCRQYLQGLSIVRVPLLFIILYTIVPFIYLSSPKALWGNDILAFLTSPFNFKENFASVYSSAFEGLPNNFVFTVVVMFISLVYPHVLAKTRLVGPEAVFLGSLIGSYTVSFIAWLSIGTPRTGTSIVGFCMVAYLCITTFFDAPTYFNKMKNRPPKPRSTIARFSFIVGVLAFSFIATLGYWLGNSAYVYHFAGASVCAIVALMIAKTRSRK
jgi:hypothetical protein